MAKNSKRRGRGEGSVFWDESRKRYVGVIDLGTDPTTGRRIRRKVSDTTKTGARDKLDHLRREHADTGVIASATYTVTDAVNDWLTMALKPSLTQSTRTAYRWAAKKITDHFGSKVLRKLTGGNVHAFLAKLARTHGTNPVRVIHRTLKRVIRFAMARDMVTRNVAEPIVTPDGQDRRKATAMTAEQAETLLKAVDGTRLEPLVILCLWGCLRRGEALALRWQDVDLETGKLKISRSLSMHDGKVVIGKVKTKASKRTIGLPDEIAPTGRSTLALTSGVLTTMRDGEVILLPRALMALRRWKTRQAAERLEFAGPYEDHDLIVCREDGRPLRPLSALRAFHKATERAGLGRAWRIHELRHTGASLYLEAGVPIHVISAYLGHADVSITAKIYLHYTAESVTLSGGTLKVAGSQ